MNRFLAWGDPTPPLPTVNPFLKTSESAGSAPQRQAVPQQPTPQPAPGQVEAEQAGAGHGATPVDSPMDRPGAELPQVRDAHAEFHRGRWKGPALLAAVVACAVGAVFLVGGGEEAKTTAAAPIEAKKEPTSVIGASLPPERTILQEETAHDHKEAFERTERAAREQADGNDESPAAPADVSSDSEFARSFRNSAKK